MDQKECIRKNISRLEKVQMGYKAEELTAKLEGGITTAHTFTMDVIVAAEKRAIEVKAQHVLAKKYACRMEKDALADKIAYGKKMGYKLETRLIIVDDSTPDHIMAVYKRNGVGNFDVQSMEFVGSYDKFGKDLGIKFDKYGKRVAESPVVERIEFNRNGKDWFQGNYPYDKAERVTDKIDELAEEIFRGTGDKKKLFKQFFDDLEEVELDRPNSFEAARQNRILTNLESVGRKKYPDWTSVPDMVTVYRGDAAGAEIGIFDSFTFDEKIAREFAGKNGVVRKFLVHKNNIPWVNSGYVSINEAELLLRKSVLREI